MVLKDLAELPTGTSTAQRVIATLRKSSGSQRAGLHLNGTCVNGSEDDPGEQSFESVHNLVSGRSSCSTATSSSATRGFQFCSAEKVASDQVQTAGRAIGCAEASSVAGWRNQATEPVTNVMSIGVDEFFSNLQDVEPMLTSQKLALWRALFA